MTNRQTQGSALRAAVIGTGKISEEHLRFLARDDRAVIVGVCDLSASLAKYAATRFGGDGALAFTDYRRMLTDAAPDVVHVLTPPHTHVQIVSECLEAGSHVVVEKPAAPTVEEAEALWSLADRRSSRLVENHNYRFNRPIRRMREMVDAGRIGDVREVEVRMCLGIRGKGGRYADQNLPHPSHKLPAGVLHEFLTHLCYLTLHFLPGCRASHATWRNNGGGDLFKYDDMDASMTKGDARARIRFSCSQAPDCFTVCVRGSSGWLETDLFQPCVAGSLPRGVGQQLTPVVNQIARGCTLAKAGVTGFWNKVMQVTAYEGLGVFLDQTYGALVAGTEPPVTREDSLDAARLIEEMLGVAA